MVYSPTGGDCSSPTTTEFSEGTVMKAISVRQPWAYAIIFALKDIENRGWPINYRGDILIHAAKTCTKKEYQLAREFCQGMGVVIPELISLRRGQVIGIVTIVDCKFSQVASGWGMAGQYHGFLL
jgi:ASCH domain